MPNSTSPNGAPLVRIASATSVPGIADFEQFHRHAGLRREFLERPVGQVERVMGDQASPLCPRSTARWWSSPGPLRPPPGDSVSGGGAGISVSGDVVAAASCNEQHRRRKGNSETVRLAHSVGGHVLPPLALPRSGSRVGDGTAVAPLSPMGSPVCVVAVTLPCGSACGAGRPASEPPPRGAQRRQHRRSGDQVQQLHSWSSLR